MNRKAVKIGTVFSGIGAPEQAFKKLGIPFNIVFACDNGDIEINESIEELKRATMEMTNKETNEFIKEIYKKSKRENYVRQSYVANYKINEDDWFEDIRFLDGRKYENKVDIFIGGSPCQSFSAIGKRAGLEDARGTLFYEFARLISEIKPRVFIYENVLGMLTHDNGNTWKIISNIFNSLGYKIYSSILNAKDFGIPQNRKRLFVVGFRDKSINFEFPKAQKLEKTVFNFLETNVDSKYYLGKKGFEFVTNPKYRNRAQVNVEIMNTQKANHQFNWNGTFIFEPLDKFKHNKEILDRAYVSTWNNQRGVIRQLSCRECLRLMGFNDNFKIIVPNVAMYKQTGNSIVVNVLECIIQQIMKVVKFNEKN